jgi:hypothetical protein
MIGFSTQVMSLGAAIALFCVMACTLMIVMLFTLPETLGRDISSLEAGAAGTVGSGLVAPRNSPHRPF